LARFLFGAEPQRVLGIMEYDPVFGTDRLTSGILEFAQGTSTFTCATQLAPYQRVNILGTNGRVEIEIPFNPPPDHRCRLWLHGGSGVEEIVFEAADHYTIQGDLFSQAVLHNTPVPTPLEDALANMQVIDALVRSARLGAWV
jgi:predicted dehydrogenase